MICGSCGNTDRSDRTGGRQRTEEHLAKHRAVIIVAVGIPEPPRCLSDRKSRQDPGRLTAQLGPRLDPGWCEVTERSAHPHGCRHRHHLPRSWTCRSRAVRDEHGDDPAVLAVAGRAEVCPAGQCGRRPGTPAVDGTVGVVVHEPAAGVHGRGRRGEGAGSRSQWADAWDRASSVMASSRSTSRASASNCWYRSPSPACSAAWS